MSDSLMWSFSAIRWPETIGAFASVATVAVAFCALRTWKHQESAANKAEFLDALIEAVHAYIADMPKSITIMEIVKIGIQAHMPKRETTNQSDITIQGAIAYIQQNEGRDSKRLLETLEAAKSSVIKLRSLAAKGQIFKFYDYAKCQDAVAELASNFDKIEAFTVVIGSPSWNWDHPDVMKLLKFALTVDPDDIRKNLRDNNIALLDFTGASYKRIYG